VTFITTCIYLSIWYQVNADLDY